MPTGKQASDFPGSFIPFDKPVGPVPTVSIGEAPTRQICVNEAWLPYVIGSLKALTRPETWDDTYDHSVRAASEVAALIGDITDGCGVTVPSKMCISGTFQDLDYGFVPTPGSPSVAVWVAGTGWEQGCNSTPQAFLDITREFGDTTLIRAFNLTILVNTPYLIDYNITLYHNGTFTSIASSTAVTGPTINVNVTGLSELASAIFIHIVETFGGCAANVKLTNWGMCYTGAFPLPGLQDTYTHVFDFSVSDQGWSPYNDGSHNYSVYSGGAWRNTLVVAGGSAYETNAITKNFAGAHIIEIIVEFSIALGNMSGATTEVDSIREDFISTLSSTPVATPPGLPWIWLGERIFTNVCFVQLIASIKTGSSSGGGSSAIRKITVRGLGVDPF